MDIMSVSKNIPKMSSPTLEIKNNYYVVKTGLLYNYYPIKVKAGQPEDGIIRFEKTPPVLMEGIAIVNKKAYHVTTGDLMRLVIRKSREVVVAVAKREKINGKAETSTSTVSETLQHSDEHRASRKTEMEISEAADNAWSEQIGALLDSFVAKEGEEWEITDSA
jgi:nitrogenase subunit NifH